MSEEKTNERWIETRDELESLPDGTAIAYGIAAMSNLGLHPLIFQKYQDGWYAVAEAEPKPSDEFPLSGFPALVLWTPPEQERTDTV